MPVHLLVAVLLAAAEVPGSPLLVAAEAPVPVITAYLRLAAPSPTRACAAFTYYAASGLVKTATPNHEPARCLTYGGYNEDNTGLAASCDGWSAPGIGAQLWRLATAGNKTTLAVRGEQSKQLAAYSCGGTWNGAGAGLETCSSTGAGSPDCGPEGADCPAAFEWARRPAAAPVGAFSLFSTVPGKEGWCVVVSGDKPPRSRPAGRAVGPLPGGGGPFSVVCNASAACPVEQTCCKMASGNFGCCPGPDASCCPGTAVGENVILLTLSLHPY